MNPKFKIQDLSKIDIKEIDINKIKNAVLGHKELALQIAIGVVAFFVIVSTLGGCQKDIKKYKTQLTAMQSKTDSIATYKKSQADIDMFLKSIPPPLTESQIITLVTDLADKNHVKIVTFSPRPSQNEKKKFYQETAIQFSLQAKDYKHVVGLIADIEHAKNTVQVKSCTIQTQTQGKSDQDSERSFLTFGIEVASLEVKQ